MICVAWSSREDLLKYGMNIFCFWDLNKVVLRDVFLAVHRASASGDDSQLDHTREATFSHCIILCMCVLHAPPPQKSSSKHKQALYYAALTRSKIRWTVVRPDPEMDSNTALCSHCAPI